MQDHLPESGNQVNHTENGTARMADFTNALTDILHEVLVHIGLVVKGSDVLQQVHIAVLLHHGEYGAVEAAPGRLNDVQLKPL
jgi:hypothetical protein